MHDKLELLLKQINLNEEYYDYFKDGNLDKISISKKNNSVEFIITLTDFLSVEVYDSFYNSLKNHFNTNLILCINKK